MKHAFSKIQDTDNMRMDETNQGHFLKRITYHKWERRGYRVWETWQEALCQEREVVPSFLL